MAERALRGTRLGATSYENDRNTDLAPRQEIAFDCPKGHHFTVPFAAEAEVPATWECRVCGTIALTAAGDQPTPKKVKPPRSHWDMLRERRSISDLEQVLAERLALIRGERGIDGNGKDSQRNGALPPFLTCDLRSFRRARVRAPAPRQVRLARRSRRPRQVTPQTVTRHKASSTIARLIFDVPCTRSTNVIGTSTTRSPARSARTARSIWKQYPWDCTSSSAIARSVCAR